jgi:callose synthase
MASDSEGKDRDLKKRLKNDPYMLWAIKECYASFENIIKCLVIGPHERKYVTTIAYMSGWDLAAGHDLV